MDAIRHNLTVFKTLLEVTLPPTSEFDPARDIPDLTGKVFIVTGANSGCGYQTVKALLAKNAKVYLACRDELKALTAIGDLERETGTKDLANFIEVDLANLKTVKSGAEDFLRKEKRLDCLINNGAVMWCSVDQFTVDGFDMQFGTNVLGHYYLTKLLLPLLLETAKINQPGDFQSGRVITLSSIGHQMVSRQGVEYDVLKASPKRKHQTTENLYYMSKLGNILFADALDRRYRNEGLISVSVNPGNIRTNLQRYADPVTWKVLDWISHPAPMGALSSLYAATTSNTSKLGGKYFVPWAQEGEKDPLAQDIHSSEKLWCWMEDQIKNIPDLQ